MKKKQKPVGSDKRMELIQNLMSAAMTWDDRKFDTYISEAQEIVNATGKVLSLQPISIVRKIAKKYGVK